MAVSGLVFLFVATLLLAFAVLLQFVAPSVLLICTVSGYAQDRLMPKYVANIYRWALVGWLIGVSLIIWWDSSNGKWMALALPIVTSLIYLLVYTWKEPNLLRGWPSLAWFMKNAGWSLTATFTVAATSLPLIIGLQIAGHVPDIEEGWQTWVAMGVCIGISAISLVPGFMYLGARTSSMGAYRPMKFAIGGVVFISYVVISGVAFFAPVSSTVLRLSGIYSNELRTFQVREPTLTSAFAAVGLNVTKKEDLTLVRAYLRYGFGGYKLLCAAPFNPAAVSQEAVKKARLDKKPDPGIVGGSHCAPAYPNEVREIRE
jgi:hypothetical protein